MADPASRAKSYVIVGGGQAALSAAAELRGLDADATITILGRENHYPYQRPPLSKAYLKGQSAPEKLYLRPPAWFAQNRVTMRRGVGAARIDRAAREVELESGERLRYDALLLATGAVPRRLPDWGRAAEPYVLRDLGHVDAMRAAFQPGRRLLVVGGGYIGLEIAAVASELGLGVTLIEAAPRILQRVAARETSDYFRALHEAHDVEILESTVLEGVAPSCGREGAVATLAGGAHVRFDFAVAGIGVTPDTGLAEAAGLGVDNGIAVDACCRTDDPAVFAAGDCASFPYGGARIRLESVQNAIDQGRAAAQAMAGLAADYRPEPWFWSDQYDVKLQIAGLNAGHDETVLRPGTREGQQSVWYLEGGRLKAVDTMNDARTFMIAKRLLAGHISPPADRLADPGFDLRAALNAA